MTDISTHEALIKDLTAIVATANAGEDALNKAKNKATKSSDQSIRAIATRVSQINDDLDTAAINTICESVATKIAGGNANVKKARKSELKLCLDQRTHISDVIREIDDRNAARKDDDALKQLNLRSATLGALRSIKRTKVTPSNAVDAIVEKTDHVATDAEKMARHLDALGGSDFFKEDGELHPGVKQVLEALRAALRGDKAPLGTLGSPEPENAPDEPGDKLDELLAASGVVLAGPDEGEPAPVETETPPEIYPEISPEVSGDAGEVETLIVEDPEEFDIESLTGGLL